MNEPAQQTITDSDGFFASLDIVTNFRELIETAHYRPVPDDWFVGTADIVGSTEHIEKGRYKMINTVGAAVISAQINAAPDIRFPYVFGGDGASFARPGSFSERAADALSRVIRWAQDEFDLEMRGAIVPVSDIRKAGLDVRLARYQPSIGVDYAMFTGGGLAWADREMKAGRFTLAAAPKGSVPNLAGLSCRWTPMQSEQGRILSILIQPRPDADPRALDELYGKVIKTEEGLDRAGHPVPEGGPGFVWPTQGLILEAHASHGTRPLFLRKIQLLFATLVALFFFKTGVKAGAFDPVDYAATTSRNADFRKFDDGLKMTIDCDAETQKKLVGLLEDATSAGLIRYGLSEQQEAIMTCIVPSVTRDDHVHFVDGAAGGYAKAASLLKGVAASS